MMRIKTFRILIITAAVVIIAGMAMFFTRINIKTGTNKITFPSLDEVPAEYWAKLAEKKIFFGHKSVGYNIIDGIKDVINEHRQIKLNIVETHDPAEFDKPIFAHCAVGRNTHPDSKIESFQKIMDAGVGDRVDLAFFKFCYVDIVYSSDPQKIFDNYARAIEQLKIRYPAAKFLHITVPIRSAPKNAKGKLKESIKLLTGKPTNANRQQYNTLLKQAYSQKDTVFDLAGVESVNPDGFRLYTLKGKEQIFFMCPQYTNDGGHLNEQGRKKVAEQLLITLAEMANKQ